MSLVGKEYINKKGHKYRVESVDGDVYTVVFDNTGYKTSVKRSTILRRRIPDKYEGKIGRHGIRNEFYHYLRRKVMGGNGSVFEEKVYYTWMGLMRKESLGEINVRTEWRDSSRFFDYCAETAPMRHDPRTVLNFDSGQKYRGIPDKASLKTAIWTTEPLLGLLTKRYITDKTLEDAVLYRSSTDTYSVNTVGDSYLYRGNMNRREAESVALSLRLEYFDDNIAMLRDPLMINTLVGIRGEFIENSFRRKRDTTKNLKRKNNNQD